MEAEVPTVWVDATQTGLTAPPPLQPRRFLQAGCPSCRPTNSVKALKAYNNNNNNTKKYNKVIIMVNKFLSCCMVVRNFGGSGGCQFMKKPYHKSLRCGTRCRGITQFYLHTYPFIHERNESYLLLHSQL